LWINDRADIFILALFFCHKVSHVCQVFCNKNKTKSLQIVTDCFSNPPNGKVGKVVLVVKSGFGGY
jgi:hypothetical protein